MKVHKKPYVYRRIGSIPTVEIFSNGFLGFTPQNRDVVIDLFNYTRVTQHHARYILIHPILAHNPPLSNTDSSMEVLTCLQTHSPSWTKLLFSMPKHHEPPRQQPCLQKNHHQISLIFTTQIKDNYMLFTNEFFTLQQDSNSYSFWNLSSIFNDWTNTNLRFADAMVSLFG